VERGPGEPLSIQRIGVLTGGGDAPGLNAVIRAVVRAAEHDYGWEVLGILDGFEGLVRPDSVIRLTTDLVRGIIARGGTILGTTNRGNPFRYQVRENGKVVVKDLSGVVLERIRTLSLDGLVVLGGDGSLTIARDLWRLGAPVVGVPKTIDNDLSATDLTFGFDTALDTATEAIDKLHDTAESHHRVMVVEVMGRNAGWIALNAGIAGAAAMILIPEIPFRLDKVIEEINRRAGEGRTSSIIVVAEGAYPVGGREFTITDPRSGAVRLGGVGTWLAEQIALHSEREVRATVLGHVQRGGSPSAFDRVLASRMGVAAVRLVAAGKFGHMVALQGAAIVDVPLDEAVGRLKTVPPEGELVQAARSLGISFGD
jgi:6-phosphofructokinase 1